MVTHVSRLGLIAFLVLGSAAVMNMVMLQPNGGRGVKTKPAPVATTSTAAAPTGSRTGAQRSAADGKASRTGGAVPLSATLDKDMVARAATEPTQQDARPVARTDARPEHPAQAATDLQDVTKALQRELKARGYETGTADGQPGLMTRAAIMAYEYDRDMPLTGEPSAQLLKLVLLGGAPVSAAAEPRAHKEQSVHATNVIRTVQQSLVTLGYVPGKVDGRTGEDTVRAIREFELDQGLPETGRVSGQLVARLARLAGQGRIAAGSR